MSPSIVSGNAAPAHDRPNGRVDPPAFSILFDRGDPADIGERQAPDFFTDLNLDQIVEAITAGRDEYNLKPFFHAPLRNAEAIEYRHGAIRDLEDPALLAHIGSFAAEMRKMRSHIAKADKLYYKPEKQRWFLDALDVYCGAVRHLLDDLISTNPGSRGFTGLREYLGAYCESDDFVALAAETGKLKADLAAVRYAVHIRGKRVQVSLYHSELDYGADVLQTFEKFKQGEAKEYRFELRPTPEMNHVEAAIAEMVARLFPETFFFLDDYCTRHKTFLDGTIARFDREVQFYVAYLEYVERFRRAGLPFCYPVVSGHSKEVYGRDIFDLALAGRLISESKPVVTNDFHLSGPERILVVSGPNQGGKTTFARTFGQLQYLAGIGCPVAASMARCFLFDRLFTHFEKEEDIRNLSSKLEDELLRIHRILESATPDSVLIMNESFLSTTLSDALFLSRQVLERIVALDMLCVSVTFLDELASRGATTVSMVSTVDPNDPALRTFKVIRKPADGLAYAVAIAEKHRLTYHKIKERIAGKRKEGTGR